jgi:hypothetical protein
LICREGDIAIFLQGSLNRGEFCKIHSMEYMQHVCRAFLRTPYTCIHIYSFTFIYMHGPHVLPAAESNFPYTCGVHVRCRCFHPAEPNCDLAPSPQNPESRKDVQVETIPDSGRDAQNGQISPGRFGRSWPFWSASGLPYVAVII